MQAGLQLYSIKDETEKDMLGALKRVAEIGYEGVEFAGYRDVSAKDMKNALNRFGLRSIGSHVGRARLESALDEEIAYNLEIGTKYIILPHAKFETADDVKTVAELLNNSAKKIEGTGLKIGYHNHAHEFETFDGAYILDLLMQETSDDVCFELDVYWASFAGVDALDYIKTRKKIEMIHIKDIKSLETKENVDVGSGILDFPSIVAAARAGGAKEFVVEQEKTAGDIWISVANGMAYLKTI